MLESLTEEITLEINRSVFVCFSTKQAFEIAVYLRVQFFKSKRKFACNARFLFCKDGAICAKNSQKRTSHGAARAIVPGYLVAVSIPDYGSSYDKVITIN